MAAPVKCVIPIDPIGAKIMSQPSFNSRHHYSADSGSNWHQQCKMSALVSRIFWLHVCAVAGSGNASLHAAYGQEENYSACENSWLWSLRKCGIWCFFWGLTRTGTKSQDIFALCCYDLDFFLNPSLARPLYFYGCAMPNHWSTSLMLECSLNAGRVWNWSLVTAAGPCHCNVTWQKNKGDCHRLWITKGLD